MKQRIIAVLAILIVASLMLPSSALSQPMVCNFHGTVTLDGTNVPDGTVVKAWIDSAEVGTTTTMSPEASSVYTLNVSGNYVGKTVSFTIGSGNVPASQTAAWEAGGVKNVDLSATTPPLTYTLTMAVTGNGSTTPAVGAHDYPQGTSVPITATADPGWQFVSWTGSITDDGDGNPATALVTMDSNKTVTANFVSTYTPAIIVDGNTGDWSGISPVANEPGDGPAVDIQQVYITSDSQSIYFRIDGMIGPPAPILIMIDADDNASTGTSLQGIGAEYMIGINTTPPSGGGPTITLINRASSPPTTLPSPGLVLGYNGAQPPTPWIYEVGLPRNLISPNFSDSHSWKIVFMSILVPAGTPSDEVPSSGAITYPAVISPTTGSISGYVYDSAVTPAPISGATVNVFDADVFTPTNFGELPVASTTTDQNGYYAISSLPDGSYKAMAVGAGYAQQFWDHTPFGRTGTGILVSSTVGAGDIDFNLVVGGPISGTVTSGGNPVPGLVVRVVDVSNAEKWWAPLTDGNGIYHVSVPNGTYRVYAPYENDPAASQYIQQYYNNKPDAGSADTVTVANAPGVSDVNFALEHIKYILTANIEPASGGAVILNPTQPEDGYVGGTFVTLAANPAPGYAFDHWSGNIPTIDSTLGEIMANPQGEAILRQCLGDTIVNQLGAAFGLSLPTVAPMSQGAITNEMVACVQTQLEQLASGATLTVQMNADKALTANFEQIDSSTGLVAYFPFNGNANDESGNGHNGTVNGATLAADRFGNNDSAYSFDGQDDYIVASASNLPTGERTVSLWFYANTVDNRPLLLGYGGSASCGTSWFMDLNTQGAQSYDMSSHCDVYTIDYYYSEPPIGNWHHFVATTDASGTKLYVDGVERATAS
ncbi:MAG: carboxypeptidase regulatory-like domain-containing protein, partial [Dehalococcoidia bacterium]